MPDARTMTDFTQQSASDENSAAGVSRDLRRVGAGLNHWYPLAWSRDLAPGKMLATRFAGDPIVLVRPKLGSVFALADRCAHRQVPLSKGVVDQGTLRCGYHGWSYDSSGRCTNIPYIGREKLPNGVRAYPCREVEGLILVFAGDPTLSEEVPLPSLGSVADPRYKTRRFGREIGCHYTFMHENLMDMNHQFLHRRQMGNIRPRFLGQDSGCDWVEARYSFARMSGAQPFGEAAIFGQRRANGEATADKDLMIIRTEYPYQTLRIWTQDKTPVMDLWIVYVPMDREQKRCRPFGLLSVLRPKYPLLLDIAWPALVLFTERIFKEDRQIVEIEQAAYDAQGADLNHEVFPVIRTLRTLLRRCGSVETPSTAPSVTRQC
jgi:phenylpropionate dioxygenase-like ring-hydroxylating dioxygenase large terminal subunit